MNEKYQIFISSTFKDLKEQRKAAIQAVVNYRHIPISLDNFGARNASDRDTIKEMIKESQILILIIGHRYGTMIEGEDISYTEYEFNLAVENELSILTFFLEQNEAEILLDEEIQNVTERAEELVRLNNFRKRVQKIAFYTPWKKDAHFAELVEIIGRSLVNLIFIGKSVSRPGWVSATTDKDVKNIQFVLDNQFILDAATNLNQFKRLDQRCTENVPEKNACANFFRERFGNVIEKGNLKLFFDSGSTPAFVAKEIGQMIARRRSVAGPHISTNQFYTNNILAFLQLWLNDGIPISMLPSSPPSDPYGASFGILEELVDAKRRPEYSRQPLDQNSANAVGKLTKEFMKILANNRCLIIGETSGIQLSEKHIISQSEGTELTSEVEKQVGQCFGFHMGSVYDKLFKRALYKTNFPVIIVTASNKIDISMDIGHCHFLFDKKYTWEDFYKNHALAFCVGCKGNEMKSTGNHFASLGFKIENAPSSFKSSAVLATNANFRKQFQELYKS